MAFGMLQHLLTFRMFEDYRTVASSSPDQNLEIKGLEIQVNDQNPKFNSNFYRALVQRAQLLKEVNSQSISGLIVTAPTVKGPRSKFSRRRPEGIQLKSNFHRASRQL